MSLIAHLHTLQDKHHQLKEAVRLESARPMPDFSQITDMKKQKLLLKEEIEQLVREHPELRREAS